MAEARRSSMAAASTSASASLKDYLKRYESGGQEKKKKKKKTNKASAPGAVLIVDEDPVWGKPVIPDEEELEAEETPVVDEDVEVKRMRRLEELRARKPYHSLSEDGSGWISITNPSKDLSPPRQRRARYDTPSPERNEKHSKETSPDLSPPRRRNSSPPEEDLSPPRRRKISRPLESDLSPPRRRNPSPQNEDLSPPRRRKKIAGEGNSPSRRRNPSPQNEDLSPPRRRKKAGDEETRPLNSDLSSPRRRKSSHLGEDLSPPRKRRNRTPVPPDSPKGRNNAAPDQTSRSPRRERRVSQEGLSLSRRGSSPPTKEDRRAGLFTGREIKEEIDRKKKEEVSRFNALDPILSGRGAEPVFRDKEGKRISKEEMQKRQKKEEKPKEKKLEWGKGLVQKKEAEARTAELELEKEKPFARSRDDPELDKMLRERTRWGDPMAHLIKKKQQLDPVLEDLGDDEKMRESGFIIPQGIPIHSWLKRGVDPPVNRYGIRPGRHWDGVDRSNGFEKQMFQRQNERRATEAEAYLWSVSDM